uniref:Glutamate rich 4 n=1 Tax=Equus asinus TaxID=9793 RepID=A0A9L0IHI5_EQUAS
LQTSSATSGATSGLLRATRVHSQRKDQRRSLLLLLASCSLGSDRVPEGRGLNTEGVWDRLLWIWEELGNLRRVDALLLGQLCSLGLEMGALREELVAFLEEEEEKESIEEEEEGKEPERKKEEGHLGASRPAHCHRLPDFEMTI